MSIASLRGRISRSARPLVAIGAVLIAAGVAWAVSSKTEVKSGQAVLTFGDTRVAFVTINNADSTVRGVVFPASSSGGSPDTSSAARHLSGGFNSSGQITATWGVAADTTNKGSVTVTFVGTDTGSGTTTLAGTTSSSLAVGETRATLTSSNYTSATGADSVQAICTVTVSNTTSTPWLGTLGFVSDTKTIRANRILNQTCEQAGLNFLVGDSAGFDTVLIFDVSLFGGPSQDGDTFLRVMVFNVEKDTFISDTIGRTSGASRSRAGGALIDDTIAGGGGAAATFSNDVRFETGTNYLYVIGLGDRVDTISILKASSYGVTDSIVFFTATVTIVDTSSGGAIATSATGGSGGPALVASSDSTTSATLSGNLGLATGPFSITVTPESGPTTVVVQNADSATSGETHLPNFIYDYQIRDNNGSLVTSMGSNALFTILITVTGDDTNICVNQGYGLIYIDPVTGQWRDLAELDQNSSIERIGGSGSSVITYRADLTRVPGVVVAPGLAPSGSVLASGDGGTCLMEAAFGGTSFEAALPVFRGARDMALGSTAGRFLTSAYYSVILFGGLLALVAFIGGGALAFRKNG